MVCRLKGSSLKRYDPIRVPYEEETNMEFLTMNEKLSISRAIS
jgi:hypothetical protein